VRIPESSLITKSLMVFSVGRSLTGFTVSKKLV
jgi:hypothetical protein